MKKLLFVLGFLWVCTVIRAQDSQITQDPAAGVILDRVAAKTSRMKSIQADFELIIEDRKEKTRNSAAGSLLLKQNKYRIISGGSTILYDGKTMWTYVEENNEVTVTEPDIQEGDLFSNPYRILALYKSDFKYRYVREVTRNGTRYHEIDLFPKNLDQSYSRIKLYTGVKDDMPQIITSVGKDGIDYTVYLKNFLLDREIGDATFVFDPAMYKKVEVIDMRGL